MFFAPPDPTAFDDGTAGSVFLVLSHVHLPYACWLFWNLRMWYALTIVISLSVFSIQYHICKANWHCFGMSDDNIVVYANGTTGTASGGVVVPVTPLSSAVDKTRLLDHVASNYAWVAIILMAILGDSQGSSPKSIIAQLIMLFTVIYAEIAYPFHNRALVIVLTVLIHMATLLLFVSMRLELPSAKRFHRAFIAGGIVMGTIGFVFYNAQLGPYDVTHSFWHIFIIGAFVLMAVGLNYDKARLLHSRNTTQP